MRWPFALLLCLPGAAWGQCNPGTGQYPNPTSGGILFGNCVPAVNITGADSAVGWQFSQPTGSNTRLFSMDQISAYTLTKLAAPPAIGNVTPGPGAFTTFSAGGGTATTAFSIDTNGDLTFPQTSPTATTPTVGKSFIGDSQKVWFQGAQWGFGTTANSTTTPYPNGTILTVQRNVTYSGAAAGNPSAMQVTLTTGPNETGLDNGLITLLNNKSNGGVYTSLTTSCFKAPAPFVSASGQICNNTNSQDQTGRMSSVAGSNVSAEFDQWASGPDDASLRVLLDAIMGEQQTSGDGATTFTYGIRMRGREFKVQLGSVFQAPTTTTYGIGVFTNSAVGAGLVGSFTNAFFNDGAGTAFNATSGTQTWPTSTPFGSGVTTITLQNSATIPGYVWPGSLVTGSGIAANTHVVTQSFNTGTNITTITIDTPTASAPGSNVNLTFTNAIGTGFNVGGYITTAAFTSPGFNVDPLGNTKALTQQITQTSTVANVATTFGTCTAGNRGKRGIVTDASAPTFLGALTGGGGITSPVFCNGGAWVSE